MDKNLAPSSAKETTTMTKDTTGAMNNQMDQLQFIKNMLRQHDQ